MKGLVVFDTKYGSTEKVAKWICGGISDTVDLKRPNEVESLEYDLLVVGSPIYGGKPLKSVADFLEENKNRLAKRRVALFLVCGDHPYPKYARRVRRFLQEFKGRALNEPVAIQVFGGYCDLKDLDEKDRKSVSAHWTKRGWGFKKMDNLNRGDAMEFGRKLKALVS